jgi:hypothetical protein
MAERFYSVQEEDSGKLPLNGATDWIGAVQQEWKEWRQSQEKWECKEKVLIYLVMSAWRGEVGGVERKMIWSGAG